MPDTSLKAKTQVQDLGQIAYAEALAYQEKLFRQKIVAKTRKEPAFLPDYLLFCEHLPVYTLGKSGKTENFLLTEDQLKNVGASFYPTHRGGDITFHGPGQWVIYPIFDLEKLGVGLREYVHLLEEVVIHTLADFDIPAGRLAKASGVWLEENRKICALGLKLSRQVSMHGLALNVNTDLRFFEYIHPCGFQDKGVTSMQAEIGKEVVMTDVQEALIHYFRKIFGIE